MMKRLAVGICLFLSQPVLGADVSGAQDPLGIDRMPHSWIVDYERDDSVRPREYVLSRVEKSRRDVRVEHEVRAAATREWATYEMRDGTQASAVFEHYLSEIGGDLLYSCRGRDCGRSNLWANDIFKRANLYGPDGNQFYFAGRYQQHLVALYVIERGNKRVYAHLEVLRPETQVDLQPNAEVAKRLAGEGFSLVEGVVPTRSGELSAGDIEALENLRDALTIFEGQRIYVVCHLHGPEDTALLIEHSQRCAERAVEALTEDTNGGRQGPEFIPFAAGPLLPRLAGGSRLELVLPHRSPRP